MITRKQSATLGVAICLIAGAVTMVALALARTAPALARPMKGKLLRRKDDVYRKPDPKERAALRGQNSGGDIAGAGQQQPAEREIEDAIPSHVPLRAKVRAEKEKATKDLNNEKWARDFELEITNVGDKPIYQFYLVLITDVEAAAGYRIVAPLTYGRTELGTISTLATPEDIPLNPGASTILKIHPSQLDAWDHMRKKEGRPLPKKVRIMFQSLSFGDGTGYSGEDGQRIPNKVLEQSQTHFYDRETNDRRNWRSDRLSPSSTSLIGNQLPAAFLPVLFLPASLATRDASRDSEPDECCGPGCTFMIDHLQHACVNCPDQNRPSNTYCGDPAGACYAPVYDSIECYIPKNPEPYLCQTILMLSCGGSSQTPSPSPSPSPTSTPIQTPTPESCPAACSDPSAAFPADECANPETPVTDSGCPLGYHRAGACCVVNPCPEPTPTPPPCSGTTFWLPAPFCTPVCVPSSPGGGGGDPIYSDNPGGSNCTPYFWVWFTSYDNGETWQIVDISYAGCW